MPSLGNTQRVKATYTATNPTAQTQSGIFLDSKPQFTRRARILNMQEPCFPTPPQPNGGLLCLPRVAVKGRAMQARSELKKHTTPIAVSSARECRSSKNNFRYGFCKCERNDPGRRRLAGELPGAEIGGIY